MKVIDNALPADIFEDVQGTFLNEAYPWFWGRSSGEHALNGNLFLYGWHHTILNSNSEATQLYAPLEPIILATLETHDKLPKDLYRIRMILNTVADKPYLNGAHIDYNNWADPENNRIALLYLNDSDGDTVIYNETYDPSMGPMDEHYNQIKDKLTVMQTVTPKANRMVIFDGRHYHTGTLPVNTARRVVMNINYGI